MYLSCSRYEGDDFSFPHFSMMFTACLLDITSVILCNVPSILPYLVCRGFFFWLWVDIESFQVLSLHTLRWPKSICSSFYCALYLLIASIKPLLCLWDKSHLMIMHNNFHVVLYSVCWYLIMHCFIMFI